MSIIPIPLRVREHAPDSQSDTGAATAMLPTHSGATELAVIPDTVRGEADLPPWDTVFNDANRPLGTGRRTRSVIALGTLAGTEAARRNGEPTPYFMLVAPGAESSIEYATIVARAASAHYRLTRRISAASQDVLDVVWSSWDARSRASVSANISEIQKLFFRIAEDAHDAGASDIHIFIADGATDVRFRIDGDALSQPYTLTADEGKRLCFAVYNTETEEGSTKHGFSMTEQQDGSLDHTFERYRLRFRYSGMPNAPHGYHVAMRIIPVAATQVIRPLVELGYAADCAERIDAAFSRSSGLILFCGTTGSGKSTTIANEIGQLLIARPNKLVLTVENPVEILIPGAHQTAVSEDQFEKTLATLMRQDPDVLMEGEIRNNDSADLALQGVRSGHLLASTLHAYSSIGALPRLNGLGVSSADIATRGLVACIVFQVLVQTLCPHCRIPAADPRVQADPASAASLGRLVRALDNGAVYGATNGRQALDSIYFRNPDGCAHCTRPNGQKGITGRTACAEVFQPRRDDYGFIRSGDQLALEDSWHARASLTDPGAMVGRTALDHACWKMLHGIVAPTEVEYQFRLFGDAD
ncbi:MAG TPA: ATPase, T2SS/T4P/T4SS family [Nevskiaceae bacterium]|nr:ATPase, T2SS/T4P/T4SS family [Nevskiaceae bacterium]